jgi:hypothetical protein
LRSVSPFVRTGRIFFQRPSGLNALERCVLKNNNGLPAYNIVRTYAAAFERTKPHVNIGQYNHAKLGRLLTKAGTIGHVDHGKV